MRTLWRPLAGDDRMELADELVGLADRGLVGVGQAALAHMSRAAVAIERADRALFEADLAHARVLAERARMPGLLSEVGWAEVSWLAALGRYDEAAVLARETHRVYRRARGWQADDILASFEVAIAHDRGELGETLDTAASLVEGVFGGAARELLAWMLAEVGELERAREMVGPAGSVPDAPSDWLWFERTTAAAHVRALLGDREACRVLRDRLAPFAGRLALGAGPFVGGADLALAAVSEVGGDLRAARRHAAAAVSTLDAVGTRPALARALVLQSRLLARTDDPAERKQAVAARARAHALAEDLGLVPVLAALDTVDLRTVDGRDTPATDGVQAGFKTAPS
jgi:hypothetical protein